MSLTLPNIRPRESRIRISSSELRRRWQSLRHEMERHDIDVIVAQANNDYIGGYVRYLSDSQPFGGFTSTVVFTRDSGTTLITTGTEADTDTRSDADGMWRGVDRLLTAPAFAAVSETAINERANVVRALAGHATARVGLLGEQMLSTATVDAIRDAYPTIRLMDASDIVDALKAVKSVEEQELLRQTARTQDEAMSAVIDSIHPGMLERDVALLAQYAAGSLGSTQGLYIIGSGNRDTPALGKSLADQNRVIGAGDMVHILIESDGPSGLYTHMTRTVVFGAIPDELNEELEFALEAQKFTLDRLRPGALPAEIWTEYNEFMRESGRPEEKRLYAHGQGFDMVERPLIRPEETMPIAAGMNLGVHPVFLHQGYLNWVCSNYLVTESGVEQLNLLPTTIYER